MTDLDKLVQELKTRRMSRTGNTEVITMKAAEAITALRAKVKAQADAIRAIQHEADFAEYGEGPVLAVREIGQLARRAAQEAGNE